MDNVDPVAYGKTRNFSDGAVTYLSPYISRGVISTKFVMDSVLKKGHYFKSIEKFLQELAWRDYWQQVWIEKKELIDQDLRSEQTGVKNHEMPAAVNDSKTGIDALDNGISSLYETGYMHNHMRMYIASVCCNVAKSHWKIPAKWMYYHLLDGDWASNALSWQWVAGSNSGKKYFANQGNINKYFNSNQRKTFLDVEYSEFASLNTPEILRTTVNPDLKTELPESHKISIDPTRPTLVYNSYNLDPNWHKDEEMNRILLLEPSAFRKHPVSSQVMNFILDLSSNIPGISILVAEFSELAQLVEEGDIIYKEHPLNRHYQGKEESRDWMFNTKGYYSSFFGFWKKCLKEKENPTLFLS